MSNVYANKRSILHRGDGRSHVSAPPDVCKTPAPPGPPIPVPYVNVARTGDLTQGSRHTHIATHPIVIANSKLANSSGDEPGTLGGIISNKNRGAMSFATASGDVKVEGKGVVRFADTTLANGNTFNVGFVAQGDFGMGTGWAYGDDTPCALECGKDVAEHRVHATEELETEVTQLLDALANCHAEIVNQRIAGEGKRAEKEREADHHVLAYDKTDRFTRPYMVGIMVCRHCKKKYATHSGNYITPGFYTTAKNRSFKVVGRRFNQPEMLSKKQIRQSNKGDNYAPTGSGAEAEGTGRPLDPRRAQLRSAFVKIHNANATFQNHQNADAIAAGSRRRIAPARNQYNCAAIKLIANAKPCKPGALIEVWFDPRDIEQSGTATPVHVDFYKRTDQVGGEPRRVTAPDETGFRPGSIVPSCSECQVMLPTYLCELTTNSCSK